jgi:hypothetical protein
MEKNIILFNELTSGQSPIKVCIYICDNPTDNPIYYTCGGWLVIFKFIKLLNEKNISSYLFSKNNNEKIIFTSNYNVPLINYIYDNTIVVYPEIIYGNPLNAKIVCRWILYDPIKRGGYKLLNSWNKNDILCSYGTYDAGLNCRIKLNVADFNENIFLFNKLSRTKKYFLIHKANLCGWSQKLLNSEITYLKTLGFQEINIGNPAIFNNLFSECSIFISFDLNTYVSNIAVLCGSLSIVKKGPLNIDSYSNIIQKRGCYGDIGIKPYTEELLFNEYNYNERYKESMLYREYIKTANNVTEFINFFNLNQTDRQAGRQAGRQTGRQADRQTDRFKLKFI